MANKKKLGLIPLILGAISSLFLVACKNKPIENVEGTVADALAGAGRYAITRNEEAVIKQTLKTFETSEFSNYDFSLTPVVLNTQKDDRISFTYVATCKDVNSNEATKDYINAYFNVADAYANNYKTTQNLLNQITQNKLTEEEQTKATLQITETLTNIINSSKIEFNASQQSVEYFKLANNILQSQTFSGLTTEDVKKAEIISTKLSLSDKTWTCNYKTQTETNDKGHEVVKRDENGNVLVNRVYGGVNLNVKAMVNKNGSNYELNASLNNFNITCPTTIYNQNERITAEYASNEINNALNGENYSRDLVTGGSPTSNATTIGMEIGENNQTFNFTKNSITVSSSSKKQSSNSSLTREKSVEELATLANEAVLQNEYGTVAGIQLFYKDEKGNVVLTETGKKFVEAISKDAALSKHQKEITDNFVETESVLNTKHIKK